MNKFEVELNEKNKVKPNKTKIEVEPNEKMEPNGKNGTKWK